MQPILESLAMYIVQSDAAGSGETRIILPNRRAGVFLKRHLARLTTRVRWSPVIFAISDFINELSKFKPCDRVEAVARLYDIYRDLKERPEPLDEFYYWGEVLLDDFDEIDKYLVDAEMLFRNIADLKEIEEPLAGLEGSQIGFIRQFWEGFHAGNITPEKEQFLEIWRMLPVLYQGLRRVLMSRGEGYPGMQYREITERIDRNEMGSSAYQQTIVAGFNALNACEKRIFGWLQQQGAAFFWDYDHLYTEDPTNEAGRFMRENLARFPSVAEIDPARGIERDKEITIYDLPTDILQAKTVHRILDQEEPGTIRECTDTAVILCDEELLMPVILAVPESIGEINVTMGYPMKNTPVSGFVELLLRLQHNIRQGRDGKLQFYHRDVRSILVHPYMEKTGAGQGHPLLEAMAAGNLVQVGEDHFESELEKKIFRCVDGPLRLIQYLREIFLHILGNLATGEGMLPALHREFVLRLLILLNRMERLLEGRPDLPQQVMERLLRKALAGLRVPFEGEPLSGLQVMGILETRLLDFRHVILLSMNEEVMPASHFSHSYIPYALRSAFGMPSREEMDAIYAYYFNRLLQRADRVDLLFNSTSEGVRTGEMSRYLHQLIHSRGTRVVRPVMEVMARETPAIVVQHTPETDARLMIYARGEDEKKYLSPSAINTYIDCPLKFYLRYMAGLGEPDRVEEEVDAAGFGTVVHDAIHLLYSEISGKNSGIIGKRELEQLLTTGRADEILTGVFKKHHFKGRKDSPIEGLNIIILRVMNRFLTRLIETDMAIAPFTLVSTERSYLRELEIRAGEKKMRVRLGGKIDLVDRVNGTLRVIDYKTGGARQGFSDLRSLFDPAEENRNGAALQTLLYAWLVASEHPGENIMPGLYVMKALYGEGFDPGLAMGGDRQRTRIDSFGPLEKEYLGLLEETLARLFSPADPFTQTAVEARCSYCDFARICNRDFIE
jgi:CRISPR/Cas system-associated exonuclease Cas4 (RecB family)